MDAALLERFLHVAEVGEQAARHDLRLAFLAGAVAHLVEAVIDEIELEIVVIDAVGLQAEHAHLAELERDAAGAAEIAAALGENARAPARPVRVGLSVAASTMTATPCGA